MDLLKRFGLGLQRARRNRGLTQEDFSVISSRTYISSLERGMKSPTISKLDELATTIGIHPLSLLALAYSPSPGEERTALIQRIVQEIATIGNN